MHRSLLFAGAALGLAFLRDPGGCGGADQTGGVNAPCTRDKDCDLDLRCTGGVCVQLDAGGDGGEDAPHDG